MHAFFKQQTRWCAGSMSMMVNPKFWQSKISIKTKLCYISGFLFYISNPLSLLLTFQTFILIALYSNQLGSLNLVMFAPLIVTSVLIQYFYIYPKAKLGTLLAHSCTVWFYSFTLLGLAFGHVEGWKPTGIKSSLSRGFLGISRFSSIYLAIYLSIVLILTHLNKLDFTNTLLYPMIFWIAINILYHTHFWLNIQHYVKNNHTSRFGFLKFRKTAYQFVIFGLIAGIMVSVGSQFLNHQSSKTAKASDIATSLSSSNSSSTNNSLDEKDASKSLLSIKIEQAINATTLPKNLTMPLEKVAQDFYYACKDDWLEALPTAKNKCELGDTTSSKVIALIGDSKIQQWIKPLDTIAKNNGFRILTYIKSNCSLSDIQYTEPTLKRDYTECYSWRQEALKQIEILKPDVIITSERLQKETNESKFEELIQKLKTISKTVIKIGDTPKLSKSAAECLSKNKDKIQLCNVTVIDSMPFLDQYQKEKLIAKKLEITLVDSLDLLCSPNICPVVIDNMVVYYDLAHLTQSYAKYLTQTLANKIEPLINNNILVPSETSQNSNNVIPTNATNQDITNSKLN
jgi:SGNH domain (fused to AT3 domains)